MPVDFNYKDRDVLYQRKQYKKGGIGRIYWDYRDRVALSYLDSNDKVIVDVGCGEGITLEHLKKRLPDSNIFGIDVLDENISICKAHNIDARKGDVYNLSEIVAGSIDAVIFMEVIEHLERPELAIKEIHRVLRKGGKVIMVFPNDIIFKISRILTLKFKEAFYDAGHKKQWTPNSMIDIIKSCGFNIIDVKSMPFIFWCTSLHGLVIGRKI